jgi:hypothetical protein
VVWGPAAYYDNGEDTAAMLRTFRRLSDLALTTEDTRNCILQKLQRW